MSPNSNRVMRSLGDGGKIWLTGWLLLSALSTQPAVGQQMGRRPLLGPTSEIYQARAACGPESKPANGPLASPFQLWQRVYDLEVESEDRRISRPVVWRDISNPGFSSRDRIDGLYFHEKREVLLAPTTLVPETQHDRDDGVPCRYLVTGGDENSRGIFRTTARTKRIAAVKIGAILNVAVVEHPVPAPETGRKHIVVDINGSCFQTVRGIDEKRPEVGHFSTTDHADRSIVKPIRWCDPQARRVSPETTEETSGAAESSQEAAGGRFQPPDGYGRAGELDALQDIFNALTHEYDLPGLRGMAYRCQAGKLEFLIEFDKETGPGLSEVFKPLFAQLVDIPHECLAPEEISWLVTPDRDPIRQPIPTNLKLSAQTNFSALDEYPWLGVPRKNTAAISGEHIASLYQRLTAQRFDLPILEHWDSRYVAKDRFLKLRLSTRGGHPASANALLRLLCAHLAATADQCSDVKALTCEAPNLNWSRQASLTPGRGCYSSDTYRNLAARGGP